MSSTALHTPHRPPAIPRPLPAPPTTEPLPPTPTASPSPKPKPSFAERKSRYRNNQKSNLEPVIEGDPKLLRDVRSPPPGDPRPTRRLSKPELAKRRSQYFEDVFQDRDSGIPQSRAAAESVVLAEVQTNVIIQDEFTFITELARHLAERYNRPMDSMIVTLRHGMCMFFGGSFAPAYSIAIHAPPSQIQSATNKRNLVLLQNHLERAVNVPRARGHVRYLPTTAEDSTKAPLKTAAENVGAPSNGTSRPEETPAHKRKTSKSLSIRRSESDSGAARRSPGKASNGWGERGQDKGPKDTRTSEAGQDDDLSAQEVKPKKSFIQTLFRRPSKMAHGETGEGQAE